MSGVSSDESLALIAHKIAPFQFDIGYAAINASIRDQVVRAQMVVRGLKKSNLLTISGRAAPERPLLICGAGIAGLAAALEAERLQIGFTLVDKYRYPSGALAGDGNRFLSPTMYEWPAPLYDEHCHPLTDKDFLAADTSSFAFGSHAPQTMQALRKQLDAMVGSKLDEWLWNASTGKQHCNWYFPEHILSDATRLRLQNLLTSEPRVPVGELPLIQLNKVGGSSPDGAMVDIDADCACILFAGGFSAERTVYNKIDFRTPPFWSQDTLTEKYFGLPAGPDRVSALIIGAGDGAIQDALRCLVRTSFAHPIDMWHHIETAIAGMTAVKAATATLYFHPTLEGILRETLSTENYAAMAFAWTGNKDVFQSIDAVHVRLCRNLLALYPRLGKVVRDMLRTDVEEVRLQRNHAFFSRCYPLNRFLIHLIDAALARSTKKAPRLALGDGALKVKKWKVIYPASGKFRYERGYKYFHMVVVRAGAETPAFQMIGLSGMDAARTHFGRIPPPIVPSKI